MERAASGFAKQEAASSGFSEFRDITDGAKCDAAEQTQFDATTAFVVSAAASEPTFRRSTMRLAFPRINSLQTDDGTASITFLQVNMNQDTGGLDYLFRFKTPSGDTEVQTTVAILKGIPAAKKYLAETGNELWSLDVTEIRKYKEKYAGEYGNIFEVRTFKVPFDTSDDSIPVLRDAFCALFFKYWSSYQYNNADETSDPADFYPDTIYFTPWALNFLFRVTLHARQGGHHD
jgi:hypothetical protein